MSLESRIERLEKGWDGDARPECGAPWGAGTYIGNPPFVEVTDTDTGEASHHLVEVSDDPDYYTPEDAARVEEASLKPCPICGARPRVSVIVVHR